MLSTFENTGFSVMQGVTGQALSAVLMGADGLCPPWHLLSRNVCGCLQYGKEVDRDLIQC